MRCLLTFCPISRIWEFFDLLLLCKFLIYSDTRDLKGMGFIHTSSQSLAYLFLLS